LFFFWFENKPSGNPAPQQSNLLIILKAKVRFRRFKVVQAIELTQSNKIKYIFMGTFYCFESDLDVYVLHTA
jgi:hypothetical protein